MSKISRSEYQRVVEQNKSLLKDLKVLTYLPDPVATTEALRRWHAYFKKEDDTNNYLKNMLSKINAKYDKR